MFLFAKDSISNVTSDYFNRCKSGLSSLVDDVKYLSYNDYDGKNTAGNRNFCDRVISEILTQEEIDKKKRVCVDICNSGHEVYIIDWISSHKEQFNELCGIHLKREIEFHIDPQRNSQSFAVNFMLNEFNKREGESKFTNPKFDILCENENDFIYISSANSSNSKSDFSMLVVGRYVQLGKWKLNTFFSITKNTDSKELKDALIEKLKQSPSINNWIESNK